MIGFLSLAVAMVLVALGCVIVPLLRGAPARASGDQSLTVLSDSVRELDAEMAAGIIDGAEYERALGELQRQALQSQQTLERARQLDGRGRWTAAMATAIGLPVTVFMVYALVGQPMALLAADSAPSSSPHAAAGSSGAESARTEAAVDALKHRLENDGSDGEGWILLARTYMQLQRIPESIGAYRKAVAVLPANPDLLVEVANTIAIGNQRQLAGEPEQLAERALQIDPDNFNALVFTGLAALQRDDRALALRRWRRLESLLPADSDDRRRIGALIAQADAKAAPDTPQPPAAGGASISGQVVLDGALSGKVAPTDTLFVYAKAIDGPPMPLAAIRARAGDLPLSFTLDDGSAMAQGMALSKFARVKVVARISRLGSPQSQPGDIEGVVADVAVGSGDVRVVMDHVVGR